VARQTVDSPPRPRAMASKKVPPLLITRTGDYSHLVAGEILLQSSRGITKSFTGNISIL
jgi:hypothetical protein